MTLYHPPNNFFMIIIKLEMIQK